jgi:hypothetical protein
LVLNAQAAELFDPADFSGDGIVDGDDLAIWSDAFGTTSGPGREPGDADLDGDVDGADFLLWQQRLGAGVTQAAAAVPEPCAASLAMISLLALAWRRSRRR